MAGLKTLMAVALISALGTGALAQTATEHATSAANIKAHMTFLASDLLEGRETGSVGYNISANYVASQFAQLGLKPAGDGNSYFQSTPFIAVRGRDEGRFVVSGKSGDVVLTPGDDVLMGKPFSPADTKVAAPMVFVGYGIEAPGHDDYRGLDVKGKIVVFMFGAPASFNAEERAYHNNRSTKRALAARHGAIGVVALQTPAEERRRPFAAGAGGWKNWSLSWTDARGAVNDVGLGAPFLASLSLAGAEKLFAGAPHTYAEVAKIAESGKAPPRFALPGRLEAIIHTETTRVRSVNVAGMLEGSDPALKSQVIVLSAHLDHVGPAASGSDRIYNGALDNASGVATMLEAARLFTRSGKAPRRSVLFLALSGEEKGLLGSQYFARNPTVPAASIVADVNLDMPILLYDFTDVVAFGADRSSIGEAVRRAAQRIGIATSPDPVPEEGAFTRSDHFRFVEVGVPAVSLMLGFQNGGEAKFREFMGGCYHKVCDDLTQPIDYAAGAKFARLNYEIARELADDDARPKWKRGDFFATRFAQPEAIAPMGQP